MMEKRNILKLALAVMPMIGLVPTGLVLAEELAEQNNVHECRRATGKIVIDGKIDESAWEKAKKIPFVIPVTLDVPIDQTEGRVLWDDQYFYVAFKAYDKDIWSYFTKRDDWTYREDCLEVFFKTDPGKDAYYDFEINALGTVFDALILKRYAGGDDLHRWSPWNCSGINVGVYIKGTLNNPSDIDEYWQMEVAIPFAELPTMGGKTPKPGDVWKLNLARCGHSVDLPDGWELSSTQITPGDRADFHDSAKWNDIKFRE